MVLVHRDEGVVLDRFRCKVFFFQAEDGIRDLTVTGVQTCALPILSNRRSTSDLSIVRRDTLHRRRRGVHDTAWQLRPGYWSGAKMRRLPPSEGPRSPMAVLGRTAVAGVRLLRRTLNGVYSRCLAWQPSAGHSYI